MNFLTFNHTSSSIAPQFKQQMRPLKGLLPFSVSTREYGAQTTLWEMTNKYSLHYPSTTLVSAFIGLLSPVGSGSFIKVHVPFQQPIEHSVGLERALVPCPICARRNEQLCSSTPTLCCIPVRCTLPVGRAGLWPCKRKEESPTSCASLCKRGCLLSGRFSSQENTVSLYRSQDIQFSSSKFRSQHASLRQSFLSLDFIPCPRSEAIRSIRHGPPLATIGVIISPPDLYI